MSQLFGGVSLKDLVILTLRQVLRTWNKNITKNKQGNEVVTNPSPDPYKIDMYLEIFFEDPNLDEDDFEDETLEPDDTYGISEGELQGVMHRLIDRHFDNLYDESTGKKRKKLFFVRVKKVWFVKGRGVGNTDLQKTFEDMKCIQILHGETVVIFRAKEYKEKKQDKLADIIPFPVKGK